MARYRRRRCIDKDDECPTVPGLVELKVAQEKFQEEVTQPKDILFNFNKATLRPESEPKLDAAAAYLKQYGNGKIFSNRSY